MSTKTSALFFSFTFVFLSVMGACSIAFIAICAGGIYSAFIEPDNNKITADVLAAAILMGFAVYQFIMAGLVLYMAWGKAASWKLHALLFVIAPLAIFFLKGVIPSRISLIVLMILAAMAIYQSLIIHYRHGQTQTRR